MWSLLYSCCFCFIAFVSHKRLVASCYCGGHFQCPLQEWKQLLFVGGGGGGGKQKVKAYAVFWSKLFCLCSYFYVFYSCTVMLVLFTEQHWLNGRAYTFPKSEPLHACKHKPHWKFVNAIQFVLLTVRPWLQTFNLHWDCVHLQYVT